MSNVTLQIAGRRYTIACAPGEEEHIKSLGDSIDARLRQLNNLSGQSAERILLYASLLLADELHEAKTATPPPAQAQGAYAEALEKMADRLESLADRLESNAAST